MTQLLISWGPATLWAGVLFFLSAQSNLPGAGAFPFSDKVGHFILFSILGVAFAWGNRNSRDIRLHAGLIFLGVLFAVSDEWHQALVPHRQPSAGDFLADMVGIVIGFFLARALVRGLGSQENKRCLTPF